MISSPPTCSPRYVGQDGLGRTGVLLIGEAPGEQEDRLGRPFVGPSGDLLNRMVGRVSVDGKALQRDDFHLFNVCPFRPPLNVISQEMVDHCREEVERVLRLLKPKAILAMGETAIRWFIPYFNTVKDWRGYIEETPWGPVIPTYHPAFLMRGNFALCEAWQHDLLRAVEVSKRGVVRAPTSYLLDPSYAEAERWVRESGEGLLAFDIETPFSGREADELVDRFEVEEEDPSYTIVRISFSHAPHQAISIPWCPPFTTLAKGLLETSRPKCVWNEAFDVPRLRANDVEVEGRVYDTMWAYHLLKPHLPYSLKYAATFWTDLPQWKHQSSSRPAWYSAVDSDALMRVHIAVERELRREKRWDLYERHVVDVSQVLRGMSTYGIGVDEALRAEARERFDTRYKVLVEELQKMAPLDIRPRKVYRSRKTSLLKRGIMKEGESWIEIAPFEEPLPSPSPPKKARKSGSRRKKGVGTSELSPPLEAGPSPQG